MIFRSLIIAASAVFFSTACFAQGSQIERGKYLTQMGDCVSCHTKEGGAKFAGGHKINTPFGAIYAPNITPDLETGIGKWSFDDFWQALHNGTGKNGKLLYPAFSYTSFTKVTEQDARAIFAYLQSLSPVSQKNKPAQMDFPFNLRSLLFAWRALYFTPGVYQADASKSPQWNRGAYIVEGLGHCNECHTSRNALGAMSQDPLLAGGTIPMQGWYALNLSTQAGGGLAGWSETDIVNLLKTGTSSKGSVLGPMADVVRNSTQHMSIEDLTAVAVYLQSLPAPIAPKTVTIVKASDYDLGKQVYHAQCAACHGNNGTDSHGIYPPLADNSTVTESTGMNAIRTVLLGGFPPATRGNPMPYSMPPFAGNLSDAEIAAVVNYIRQSWNNNVSPVSAEQVKQARWISTK